MIMIEIKIGDILESKAQTLVNTVNTVGVMGKGIALGFKNKFPYMYEDYLRKCKAAEVKLGKPYIYKGLILPWVINFPTKDDWRSVSKTADIVNGLEFILTQYKNWGVKSVAFPPLGCGEGGLEWRIIGRLLYKYLKRLDIGVELYAPYGTPRSELSPEFFEEAGAAVKVDDLVPLDESKVKSGWFTFVEVINRVNKRRFGMRVGRTSFQKLAYLATRAGVPTGLNFIKGSYGPFSKEVKPLLTLLINNGLLNEEKHGRFFLIDTGPTYDVAKPLYSTLVDEWDPLIDRLSDLFSRINSGQAELVTTILYISDEISESKGSKPTETEIFNAFLKWKKRRKPSFPEPVVADVIRTLGVMQWIDAEVSNDLPLVYSD